MFIIIISIIGLLFSIYAYYVEKKVKTSKKYKPLCDIGDKISCSKAFKSEYAKSFYLSNSFFGIIYYASIIFLYFIAEKLILFASIPALLFTFYLAYASYYKMKNFCIVCTAIYIINILIFIFSFF